MTPTGVESLDSRPSPLPHVGQQEVEQMNADVSVRINNYERLFACAEHLAAVKKQLDEYVKEDEEFQKDGMMPTYSQRPQTISELQTTVGRIYIQMAEELGLQVPPMDPKLAEDNLTGLLHRVIPRDEYGNLLSIGSIPHFCGEACVGPCRFHRKGKCFDGPLCRFCHIPGDNHPGAVKKISKKSRKAKKSPNRNGYGQQGEDQTALAALFAALDVSHDSPADVRGAYGYPNGMGAYAQNQAYDPYGMSASAGFGMHYGDVGWAAGNAQVY
jgi:hypothetical protein